MLLSLSFSGSSVFFSPLLQGDIGYFLSDFQVDILMDEAGLLKKMASGSLYNDSLDFPVCTRMELLDSAKLPLTTRKIFT